MGHKSKDKNGPKDIGQTKILLATAAHNFSKTDQNRTKHHDQDKKWRGLLDKDFGRKCCRYTGLMKSPSDS